VGDADEQRRPLDGRRPTRRDDERHVGRGDAEALGEEAAGGLAAERERTAAFGV
jgi:hypothetical protein